jgi:hypothetical protein
MEKLLAFWQRNKLFIISVFGFLLVMNWCGRLMMPPSSPKPAEMVSPLVDLEEVDEGMPRLKTYEELMTERSRGNDGDPASFFLFVMMLTALFLMGYYSYKKGWLSTLWPEWVRMNIRLYYERKSGRLLLKLFVFNNTAESKTFMRPYLFFRKWGFSRSFVIKNDAFPLTLTPGTGHSIVMDVEQFWEKIPDLKGFNRIGASIETTFGKSYRTWAYPRWFVVGKI